MRKLHCGLDFGTSNSVIALPEESGDRVRVAAREPSVVFFPKQGICESICFVGQEAIDAYIEYGMQGRFVQSIKRLLSDTEFAGTFINRRPYRSADLAALVLGHLKRKAEIDAGRAIDSAVIGRPVIFSADPAADRNAELSLKNAARMAGFRDVEFQYEPVAAAFAYEKRLGEPEIVLVADLGGGTTDFTLMRLRPGPGGPADRRNDVLATGGVRVGGNDFDSAIMWNKLVGYFGRGSTYESWGKQLEVPVHIFRTLCRWEQIAFLKSGRYREDLRYFRSGAGDRAAIDRLITLIDEDLGYSLFRSIEDAKIFLADWDAGSIEFSSRGIEIQERITEPELNGMILSDLRRIRKTVDEVLRKGGLGEEDVSAVFLTGGSSLVRRVQKLFRDRFGDEKVRTGADTFTSVASGLALCKGCFPGNDA